MTDIQVVTHARHGDKSWKRHDNYLFAAKDAICPLVVRELPKAMMALPIAFLARGEQFSPVLLQGFEQGKNLMVNNNGHWRGRYLPEMYQSYPFLLVNDEEGKQVLCLDEDSGVLVEGDDAEGQRLFNNEGEPTDTTQQLVKLLGGYLTNQEATAEICKILQEHELIEPWPMKISLQEQVREIQGLFRVSEAKFNELDSDALLSLRNSRALTVAYCQMLSTNHLEGLVKAANQTVASSSTEEINFGGLEDQDTLNFDNF